MSDEKNIFHQKFPTIQYGNVLMGIERPLRPGETHKEAFAESKRETEESFKELFPSPVRMTTDYNTGEQRPAPSAAQAKAEADKEFEDFKKQIDSFKKKDQAEKFLSLSQFKLSIEAKKYITEKFKTDGQDK